MPVAMKRIVTMQPVPSATRGLRRVLVAVDFSEGSERGWQRALRVPLDPAANLQVVHVLPIQERRKSRLDKVLEIYAARELQKIVRAMQRILVRAGMRGVAVTCEVRHGAPYDEIVQAARDHRSELIVVGRSGRQGLRHFLLGSTAERVIWSSAIPVLVAQEPRPRPYRRVLVAFDNSVAARAAFRAGIRLADEAARIDVVRATDLSHLLAAKNLGVSLRRVREIAAREQRDAERGMASVLAECGGEELDVRLAVRHGSPVSVILDELKRHKSELIVLGTHSRSGIQRAILGSVAESVVRRATGDVLVARSEAPAAQRPRRKPSVSGGSGDGALGGPIVLH